MCRLSLSFSTLRPTGRTAMKAHIYALRLLAVTIALIALNAQGAGALSAGFIENRGQVDEEVLYYAPGPRATVYFTRDALVFDLRERELEGEGDPLQPWESDGDDVRGRLPLAGDVGIDKLSESTGRRGCAVWARFDGGQALPRVEARGELPGRYNFFLGNDPAGWQTDVRSHEEVIYHDLWPGVDLVFRSRDGELVYEAVAVDGGRLPAVLFRYEGAEEVVGQGEVEVWVETLVGGLLEIRTSNGKGRFLLAEDGLTGGGRSEDRDDPSALLWNTFLGGSDLDYGIALALDPSGNPILTGYTASSDFPTTPGAYDTSHNGYYYDDVFVAKLSSTGETLLWSTFLGGSGDDRGFALALDPSGNPVLTGNTRSSDFPTTPGAYDTSHNGGTDVFVAKLSSTGETLLWSTFLGGSAGEAGLALALDPSGNSVLTGYTRSSDFPTTAGAYDTSFNGGGWDVFVAKLSSTGETLLWSTFLGGSAREVGHALALDPSGNPVLTGDTTSSGFPTTPGAYDTSYNGGGGDIFVAKLSSTGETLFWSTFLGESGEDRGFALALDPSGDPVLTGRTTSSDFPATPGVYDTSFNGGGDVIVAKLSSTGETLLWSTFLGGNSTEYGPGLALDPSGNPILTGYTASYDFPTTPGAYDTSYNGCWDAFVAKLSSTGETLLWSTFLGGSDLDYGSALALNPSGNPILTGYTASYDFPTTPGAYDTSYNGGEDAFVARLDLSGGSGVQESAPLGFAGLLPSMPSPFSSSLIIRYALAQEKDVDLRILDITGRVVSAFSEGMHPAGTHQVTWNGRNAHGQRIAPGVYFVRLRAGGDEFHRKIMMIR